MKRWILIANLAVLAVLLLFLGLAALLQDDREVILPSDETATGTAQDDSAAAGEAPAGAGQPGGTALPAPPVEKRDVLAESGPLLEYADPYLRGRGDWFRERFAALRTELPGLEVPEEGIYETKVVRDPLTAGPWLEKLPAGSVELRRIAEGQIVEARAMYTVAGVKPLDLLVFVICSDFKAQIPNDPMDRVDHVFPGFEKAEDCLDKPPKLKPNQVLAHEVWKPALLRKGTDIWFIHELRRKGDSFYFIYRIVKSCQPTDSYTQVYLATGQYVVIPSESGSIVLVKSYYNGQSIPKISDFLVRNRTNSFYSAIAAFLAAKVPSWEPSERVKAWREGLGLED